MRLVPLAVHSNLRLSTRNRHSSVPRNGKGNGGSQRSSHSSSQLRVIPRRTRTATHSRICRTTGITPHRSRTRSPSRPPLKTRQRSIRTATIVRQRRSRVPRLSRRRQRLRLVRKFMRTVTMCRRTRRLTLSRKRSRRAEVLRTRSLRRRRREHTCTRMAITTALASSRLPTEPLVLDRMPWWCPQTRRFTETGTILHRQLTPRRRIPFHRATANRPALIRISR